MDNKLLNDPRAFDFLSHEITIAKESIVSINNDINELKKTKKQKIDFKENLNVKLSMYTESIHTQTSRIDSEVTQINAKIKQQIDNLNQVKLMIKFKQNICKEIRYFLFTFN
jgi:predicted  nucleic acid-binding Zn-ribbon protein